MNDYRYSWFCHLHRHHQWFKGTPGVYKTIACSFQPHRPQQAGNGLPLVNIGCRDSDTIKICKRIGNNDLHSIRASNNQLGHPKPPRRGNTSSGRPPIHPYFRRPRHVAQIQNPITFSNPLIVYLTGTPVPHNSRIGAKPELRPVAGLYPALAARQGNGLRESIPGK